MNGPMTRTMVWGLTVGAGGGVGRREQRGKNWDNCNIINFFTVEETLVKNMKKIKEHSDKV